MNGPAQYPPLVEGQQIRNGPYTITVTASMVRQRERENRELERRWLIEERRRRRLMELYGGDEDEYFGDFKHSNIRRRFVRRVFSILTVQMIFTGVVMGVFMFVEEAKEFLLSQQLLLLVVTVVFMATYLSISCCSCARREAPCNVINLFLLTTSMSYTTAYVSVIYTAESVVIAVGTTALVVMVIFFVATCTSFDLTKRAGAMVIVSLICLFGMLALLLTSRYTTLNILQVGIGVLGSLVISLYLFYDVQTIMGGRTMELSPDEVVYATTQLYVDILLLYRYILLLEGNFD